MSGNVVPMGNVLLEAALEYVARGWAVFPCAPRSKKPITAHGFKDASTDPVQVAAWWKKSPRANIGVPTGPRTFDVLDVDGPTGEQSLAALEAKHDELPLGPRQQTGTGRHILFRGGTLGVSAKRLPGLDTRGEGGYVVMAPSIHPSGERYVLEDEGEPIPEPPAWLVAELRSGRGTVPFREPAAPVVIDDLHARTLLGMAEFNMEEIPEGVRDETLFKRACSMRGMGHDFDTILEILRLANRHLCRPPISDSEVVAKARSAMRYEPSAEFQRAQAKIESRAEAVAQEAALAASVARGFSEPARESLETLREMLNIPLERVEKRGKDYYLVLAEGKAVWLRNLLAYDEVERALFDELGVLVAVKRKGWKAAAVRLRSIALELDPGLASEAQETLHYLKSFLEDENPDTAQSEDELCALRVAGHSRIRYGAELWFLFDAFREHCDRAGLREPVRALWKRIRETGILREEKTFRHGGEHHTRRYWVAVVGSNTQEDL